MNRKLIIIILSVLFIISSSLSLIGFIHHEKNKKQNNLPPIKEKITYEYYLEDELQKNIPSNETDEDGVHLYKYTKYTCNNGITGNFNEDTWEFEVSEEKKGTCKIYFVKSFYDVDITATNGEVDENNERKISRESDGQFKITPTDGYEFNEVNCSNNKKADYNKKTNILTINAITEDVACKIDFDIKAVKMTLKVKNGSGNTEETVNYGESVAVLVQPKDGYEKPTVVCTNNQEAIIKDGTLSIQKLTKDTVCTATYTKIPIIKYKLSIVLPEHATLVSGNTTQQIVAGKDASFSVKPDDNYELEINCGGPRPEMESLDDGTVNYTLLEVNKSLTCTITAKEKPQETNPDE